MRRAKNAWSPRSTPAQTTGLAVWVRTPRETIAQGGFSGAFESAVAASFCRGDTVIGVRDARL